MQNQIIKKKSIDKIFSRLNSTLALVKDFKTYIKHISRKSDDKISLYFMHNENRVKSSTNGAKLAVISTQDSYYLKILSKYSGIKILKTTSKIKALYISSF